MFRWMTKPCISRESASLELGAVPLRFVVFGIWLILVVGVAAMLWRVENETLVRKQGVAVGKLKTAEGKVRVKPADSIVWYDSFPDQTFYCGDTVATSLGAKATIVLGASQTLSLGESSMVSIDADIIEPLANDITPLEFAGSAGQRKVQIMKGDVVAKVAHSDQAQGVNGGEKITASSGLLGNIASNQGADAVSIKAKGESFNVQEGAELGMVVVPEMANPLISKVAGTVSIINGRRSELVAQTSERLKRDLNALKSPDLRRPDNMAQDANNDLALLSAPSAEDDKTPNLDADKSKNAQKAKGKQSPSAKEKLAAKNPEVMENLSEMIPKITSAKERYLWYPSRRELASMAAIAFTLEVNVPKDAPKEWTPYIELVSKFGDGAIKVTGVPNKAKQTLLISSEQMAPLISQSTPKVSIQIRSGIVSNKTLKFERSPFQSTLQLGNLSGFGSGPLVVQMQKFGWDENASGWISMSKPDILSHEIALSDGRDVAKIIPMLRAAEAFDIQKGTVDRGKGVHFLLGNEFLASLYSGKATTGAIRKIGRILNADYAYRGKRTDLIDLPSAKRNRLGVVEANAKKYGTVYVISRQRVIALSADLFKQQAGIVSSIAYNISAAFKGEVNLEFVGH